MALLIVNLDKQIGNAAAWRDTFAAQLPDLEIRIWPEAGKATDIEYLAFIRPDFDALPELPNLKAMFSRSAGVEAFVDHPRLPKAPLGKIEPSGGDPMMTEYVVMHVLRFHRDMPGYQMAQANREWRRTRIARPEERRVGFLGLGLMAKAPALVLKSLGLPVSAWVRSPRKDEEIPIFHGPGQLEPFLNQTDIAVCLLPLTRETEGIFCGARFGAVVLRRARRAVAGALAAGEPVMAAPQGDGDAACRAAADRGAAGDRDRRQHPQHRGGRDAAAGNRQDDGLLSCRTRSQFTMRR